MKIVILAGGLGRRLRPYTTVLPKPLMPVGERPILELLIGQLKEHHIDEVIISVGYLSGLIEAYFGDGLRFGVDITYLRESNPLGTVGPIGLLKGVSEPFLVMNGDILTDFDFSEFVRYHASGDQELTIAAYQKEVKIDLGVLDVQSDGIVIDYIEKPTLKRSCSMGIYCCSPSIVELIPSDTQYDLPDLVLDMIRLGRRVRAYPHNGLWLDIGRQDDYERAQDLVDRIFHRVS